MTVITPCLIKKKDKDSFEATYPEYPDCKVEATSLESAMNRAVAYLCSWLRVHDEKPVPHKNPLRPPGKLENDEFFTLISANLDEFDDMIKFYDVDITQFFEWLNGDLDIVSVKHIRENDNSGIDDIDMPDDGEFEPEYDTETDIDDDDIPESAYTDNSSDDDISEENDDGKPERSAVSILSEILDEEIQSREETKKKKEENKKKPVEDLEERMNRVNKTPADDFESMFGEFSFSVPTKRKKEKETSLDKTLNKIKEEELKKDKPMIEKLSTDVDDGDFVFTPYQPSEGNGDKGGNKKVDLLDENNKNNRSGNPNKKKKKKKKKNYNNNNNNNQSGSSGQGSAGQNKTQEVKVSDSDSGALDETDVSSETSDGKPRRMFNPDE